MKVAYNFICPLKGWYLFPELIDILTFICKSNLSIQSKISIGDVLIYTNNLELWHARAEKIYSAAIEGWHSDINAMKEIAGKNMSFAIVFHTLNEENANKIDIYLRKYEHYIGAFQVDDTVGIIWACYTSSLSDYYKLNGKKFYLLWSGIDEEEKENMDIEIFYKIPFDSIEFESKEMKGTLFDGDGYFEKQVNMARSRKYLPKVFNPKISDSIVDNIIFKVGDSAPALGDKIYAMLKSFLTAENCEDYAHIAISCRRTLEYLANTLFPPIKANENDEVKLGPQESKNRLLAFAHKESDRSESLLNFIRNGSELKKKLDKTLSLQNKGLHAEIDGDSAKKCIIDTILLINDFVSLPWHSLPPTIRPDEEFMKALFGGDGDTLD